MNVTRKHSFSADWHGDVANGFGELWLISITPCGNNLFFINGVSLKNIIISIANKILFIINIKMINLQINVSA